LHLFNSGKVLYHRYLSKTSNTTQSSGTPFYVRGNACLVAKFIWVGCGTSIGPCVVYV